MKATSVVDRWYKKRQDKVQVRLGYPEPLGHPSCRQRHRILALYDKLAPTR